MKCIIKTILAFVLMASSTFFILFTRLSNASLTETQLFIKFWWQWLICIVVYFLALYIYIGRGEKGE